MSTSHSRWFRISVTLVLLAGALASGRAVLGQEIHGFVEALNGVRTVEGSGFDEGSYTSRETRLQLKVSDYSDDAEYFTRVDVFFDQLAEDEEDLELREAFFTYSGFGSLDFKFGRQITTWGTGDLIFINDVFPKDWQSFFIGREDQYLKAPVDALRFGFYSDAFNLNAVIMPEFEPDRLPEADRLASYNPLGMVDTEQPESEVDEGELALRLYRGFGGLEVNFYGFFGHYRQPVGFDPASMQLFYPELNVYGASARRSLLGGVVNGEAGFYDSRDDEDGDNPNVENSSFQWMAGFDRQLWTDFNLGLQGYYEWMMDHDRYVDGLPPGAFERDEVRQVYTVRLTKLLKYQTVRLSLFTFGSPTDEDLYVRALASYKLSDPLEVALGANFFAGDDAETLFGQFDDNDNIYLRARYSF
jgi:hypothetical protein